MDTKTVTVHIALTFDATDLIDRIGRERALTSLERTITMANDMHAPSVRRAIEDLVFAELNCVRVKDEDIPVALRDVSVVSVPER